MNKGNISLGFIKMGLEFTSVWLKKYNNNKTNSKKESFSIFNRFNSHPEKSGYFQNWKLLWKGKRFADINDIQPEITTWVQGIPENEFPTITALTYEMHWLGKCIAS